MNIHFQCIPANNESLENSQLKSSLHTFDICLISEAELESFAFHNPLQSSLSARIFNFAKGEEMPGLERINRCGRLIEGTRRDFLKYYLKKCPTLFHICYDPIGTHRKARAFIGFLFGFLAAVVLYEGIIVDLQFDAYTSISLGAILVMMLSIGCASSIQVISFSYFT